MAGRRPGWTAVLGALCVALLALILLEIRYRSQLALEPPGAATLGGDSSDRPPTPSLEAAAELPIEAAVERPLFSPSRSQAMTAAPVEPIPTLAGFSLIGIAISPDERVAMLVPAGGGGLTRLREGESYEGWSAVSIEPDHVVFRQGDVEERLYLDFNLSPPAAAPAASPEAATGQQPWDSDEPLNREEPEPTMGGADGNANP
jgi:hypothetical protein